MLKKVLFAAIVASLVISGCKKKSPPPSPQPVQQAKPQLPPTDQLGTKTTFEVTYRGMTGKEDDLPISGGYGFGSSNREESPFVKAVRKKTDNDLFISRNPFLHERESTVIEYRDKEVLYVYFDLNADGKLSDDEQLSPADVTERNRRGDDCTVFMTSDFEVTDDMGNKTPFRIMLWVAFYGNSKEPNVTWSPAGLYEGVAELNGQPMRLYLFPDFSSKCYTYYRRSSYGLVPASQDKGEYVPEPSLSSLIVQGNLFYRLTVDEINPDAKTITVSLIEDKTPRGKIALDIKGKDTFKHDLGYASLQGVDDKTIYFNILKGMDGLPVGDYAISYGSLAYGTEESKEYYASFQNVPAFTIKENQTTTIEMGNPQVKVQAVEENKRYNDNKVYKTEFAEGTEIYIDASFVGIAKEVYGSFAHRVQKENYMNYEDIKARIVIADDKGNEVANKELEYG